MANAAGIIKSIGTAGDAGIVFSKVHAFSTEVEEEASLSTAGADVIKEDKFTPIEPKF